MAIIFEHQSPEWQEKFRQLMLCQENMTRYCKLYNLKYPKKMINWEKLDNEAKQASLREIETFINE